MKHIESKGRSMLGILGATLLLLVICWPILPLATCALGGLLVFEAGLAGRYTAIRDMSDNYAEDRQLSGFWTYLGLLGYIPIIIGFTLFGIGISNHDYEIFWPVSSFLFLTSGCHILFYLSKKETEKAIFENFSEEQLARIRAERIIDLYERHYGENIRSAIDDRGSWQERRLAALTAVNKAISATHRQDIPDFDVLFPGTHPTKCLTKLFDGEFHFSGKVTPRTINLHALILLCYGRQWSNQDEYLILIKEINIGLRPSAQYQIFRYFDFDQRNDPYFSEPAPRGGLGKKSPVILTRNTDRPLSRGTAAPRWEEVYHECLPSNN